MKGIILAGGQSKRMGEDKAILEVNGSRLIDRVYDAFKRQVDEVMLSSPHDYGLGIPVVSDISLGPRGPVAGLYAAWAYLKQRGEPKGFFTVPVDAPLLPMDLCERLYGDKSAVAVSSNGMHQTFAWWHMDDLARIFQTANFEDKMSLKCIVNKSNARHVFWPDEKLFYNINTPNDLSEYLTANTSSK